MSDSFSRSGLFHLNYAIFLPKVSSSALHQPGAFQIFGTTVLISPSQLSCSPKHLVWKQIWKYNVWMWRAGISELVLPPLHCCFCLQWVAQTTVWSGDSMSDTWSFHEQKLPPASESLPPTCREWIKSILESCNRATDLWRHLPANHLL